MPKCFYNVCTFLIVELNYLWFHSNSDHVNLWRLNTDAFIGQHGTVVSMLDFKHYCHCSVLDGPRNRLKSDLLSRTLCITIQLK